MKNEIANVEIVNVDSSSALDIKLIEGGISAGFPSPAQDYLEHSIDLNKELIRNPSSTFLGRVKGDSMKDAGIENGDILVIDKSLQAQNGDTAVCYIDGEFTLKIIRIEADGVYLIPANEAYKPIKVTEDNNFVIWGIVSYSIKNHQRKR